ncbi:MAG: cobalamin-dependent protein [Lachnospiraceae bacterium]
MEKIIEIREAVEAGRTKCIAKLTREALEEGISAEKILKVLIGALENVGEKFRREEIFVPEMLVCAKTMKMSVEILRPELVTKREKSLGTVMIGTVAGDLHDIGKNLVGMMCESVGIEVIDLGIDVPAERFITEINRHPEVEIVMLSALLTATLPSLKKTVQLLGRQSFRKNIKIMVGGLPVTEKFAMEIGADVYTEDAASAALKAKEFLEVLG